MARQHDEQGAGPIQASPRPLDPDDRAIAEWKQNLRKGEGEYFRKAGITRNRAPSELTFMNGSGDVCADGESPKGTTRLLSASETPRSTTKGHQKGSLGRESPRFLQSSSRFQSPPPSPPSGRSPGSPPELPTRSTRGDAPEPPLIYWSEIEDAIIVLLCLVGLYQMQPFIHSLWLHGVRIRRERFGGKQSIDLRDIFLVIALLCIGLHYTSRKAFDASKFLRVSHRCSLIWTILYFLPQYSWTLNELYNCVVRRAGWQGFRYAILPLAVVVIVLLGPLCWLMINQACRDIVTKTRAAKYAIAGLLRPIPGLSSDVAARARTWLSNSCQKIADVIDFVYARVGWVSLIVWIDRVSAAFLRFVFQLKPPAEPPLRTPDLAIPGGLPRTPATPTSPAAPETPNTPQVRRWAQKRGVTRFFDFFMRSGSGSGPPSADSSTRPTRSLSRSTPWWSASSHTDPRSTPPTSNDSNGAGSSSRSSSQSSETAAMIRRLVIQRVAQRAARGDTDTAADLQNGQIPGPWSNRGESGADSQGGPQPSSQTKKEGKRPVVSLPAKRSATNLGAGNLNRRSPGGSALKQEWNVDDPEEEDADSENALRKNMLSFIYRNSDGCIIDRDGVFTSPSGHTLGKIIPASEQSACLTGCEIIAGGQLWKESMGLGTNVGQLSRRHIMELNGDAREAALLEEGGEIQVKFGFRDAQRKLLSAIWLVNFFRCEEYYKELIGVEDEKGPRQSSPMDIFEGWTIDGAGSLLSVDGKRRFKLSLIDQLDENLAGTRIAAGAVIRRQSSDNAIGLLVNMPDLSEEELVKYEHGEAFVSELVYLRFWPPEGLRTVKIAVDPLTWDSHDFMDLLPEVLYTGKGFIIGRGSSKDGWQLTFADGTVWGSAYLTGSNCQDALPGCSVDEDGTMHSTTRGEIPVVIGRAGRILISRHEYAKVEKGGRGWCELHYTLYLGERRYTTGDLEQDWHVSLCIRKPMPAVGNLDPQMTPSNFGRVSNLDVHIGNQLYGDAESAFAAAYSIRHVLTKIQTRIESWASWLNPGVDPRNLEKGAMDNVEVMSALWNTEVFLENLVETKRRGQGELPRTAYEDALHIVPDVVDLLTQIDDATSGYTERADIEHHITARAIHIYELLRQLADADDNEKAPRYIYTGHGSGEEPQLESQRNHASPFSPRTMPGSKRRRLAEDLPGSAASSGPGAGESPMSVDTPRVRFAIDTRPGETWWRSEPTPVIVTPRGPKRHQLPELTPAQYLAREEELDELFRLQKRFERLGTEGNNLIHSLWSDHSRDDRDITAFDVRRDALVDALVLEVFQPLESIFGEDDYVREVKMQFEGHVYHHVGLFRESLQRIRDEWDMSGTLLGLTYDDLAPPFPIIEEPKRKKKTSNKVRQDHFDDEGQPNSQNSNRFPIYDEAVRTALKEIDGIWQQARSFKDQEQKLLRGTNALTAERLLRFRQSEDRVKSGILSKLKKYLANTEQMGSSRSHAPVTHLVRERAQRMDERIREMFALPPTPGIYTLAHLAGLKVQLDGVVYDSYRKPVAKLMEGDPAQLTELIIGGDGTIKDAEGQIRGIVELTAVPESQDNQANEQSNSGADNTDAPGAEAGGNAGEGLGKGAAPGRDNADSTMTEANTTHLGRDLFQIYQGQVFVNQLRQAERAAETLRGRAQRLWNVVMTAADPSSFSMEEAEVDLAAISSLVESDILRKAQGVVDHAFVSADVKVQAAGLVQEVNAQYALFWESITAQLHQLSQPPPPPTPPPSRPSWNPNANQGSPLELQNLLYLAYSNNSSLLEAIDIIQSGVSDDTQPPRFLRNQNITLEDCTISDDGWLLVQSMIFVPAYRNLRQKIIQHFYHPPARRRPDVDRACARIRGKGFWWRNMERDVQRYLQGLRGGGGGSEGGGRGGGGGGGGNGNGPRGGGGGNGGGNGPRGGGGGGGGGDRPRGGGGPGPRGGGGGPRGGGGQPGGENGGGNGGGNGGNGGNGRGGRRDDDDEVL